MDENGVSKKRPTSVTVVGWVWIWLGALFLVDTAMLLAAATTMPVTYPPPNGSRTDAIVLAVIVLVACLLGGLGVLAIIAARGFLKLKRWACSVLLVLTWILFLYVAMGGVVWAVVWAVMQLRDQNVMWAVMGLVMDAFITASFGIPTWIMLRTLSSLEMKRTFGMMEPNGDEDPQRVTAM
jgi:hypothetical protein